MNGLVGRVVAATRGTATDDPRVERLTAGERMLLVECEGDEYEGGGRAAVAHRPPGPLPAVEGERALTVGSRAADADATPGERAAGLAALSALAVPHVRWERGDPMAGLAGSVETVVTVGLFRPALGRFGASEVRVVERDPVEETGPPGVTVRGYAPEERAGAFAGADVAFVTGSTLVYGGADDYLATARGAGVPVVLIGATASFLPDPAFESGVAVLAGARVTDAAALRAPIERGDCATDVHEVGLEKVFVARDPLPPVFG